MAQRMNEVESELEDYLNNMSVISDVDISLRDFMEARFGPVASGEIV